MSSPEHLALASAAGSPTTWHRALRCESACCKHYFYFGGRHHCRRCNKSVCSDHFVRPYCDACLPNVVVEEVLAVLEMLRHEPSPSSPLLPIKSHDTRLPSEDRAVSLLFLTAVRRFYAAHGGMQLAAATRLTLRHARNGWFGAYATL